MHVVRLETKEELLELLDWIFFRKEGEFTEMMEARLSFEETCSILGIHDDDFAPGLDCFSDEYYDIVDNLDESDLRKMVLSDKVELVRDFVPGTLVWCLEDDFDRIGDMNIRVFTFTPDSHGTATAHREWRKAKQAEYEEDCELRSRLVELKSQL